MKCSIALAVWNGSKHIGEQLASFAAQTRLPDELVVCDNGSTDGTQEIVKKFAAQAPFPVRIHQNEANIGYSNNFAKATTLCSHEIIFWSDCDDYWLPEKLADFCTRFESDPALLLLFSDSELVNSSLQPIGGTFFSATNFTEEERALVRSGMAWKVLFRRNIMQGNTVAFRREVGKVMRTVPPGVVHDEWLITAVAALGKIDFFEKPYVRYRIHASQNVSVVTGSLWNRLALRWKRARSSSRNEWLEEAGHLSAFLEQPEIAAHAALSSELRAKREWLKERANFPEWKLLRLPLVLRHAAAYHRFDNGWQTMLKDLLLP